MFTVSTELKDIVSNPRFYFSSSSNLALKRHRRGSSGGTAVTDDDIDDIDVDEEDNDDVDNIGTIPI